MDLLEYRLLRPGEEETALNFFYSNFVTREGQLSSVGAGRNEEVTRDMQTMLTTGIYAIPDLALEAGIEYY